MKTPIRGGGHDDEAEQGTMQQAAHEKNNINARNLYTYITTTVTKAATTTLSRHVEHVLEHVQTYFSISVEIEINLRRLGLSQQWGRVLCLFVLTTLG